MTHTTAWQVEVEQRDVGTGRHGVQVAVIPCHAQGLIILAGRCL